MLLQRCNTFVVLLQRCDVRSQVDISCANYGTLWTFLEPIMPPPPTSARSLLEKQTKEKQTKAVSQSSEKKRKKLDQAPPPRVTPRQAAIEAKARQEKQLREQAKGDDIENMSEDERDGEPLAAREAEMRQKMLAATSVIAAPAVKDADEVQVEYPSVAAALAASPDAVVVGSKRKRRKTKSE